MILPSFTFCTFIFYFFNGTACAFFKQGLPGAPGLKGDSGDSGPQVWQHNLLDNQHFHATLSLHNPFLV